MAVPHVTIGAMVSTMLRGAVPFAQETWRIVSISRGAQDQIAVFLASGGTVIIHPEPAQFFEVPIGSPLPGN